MKFSNETNWILLSGKSNVDDDSNATRSGKRVKGKVDNNINESIDRIGKFDYGDEFHDYNRDDPSIVNNVYLPNDQQPKTSSASFPDNIDQRNLQSSGNGEKNESTVLIGGAPFPIQTQIKNPVKSIMK